MLATREEGMAARRSAERSTDLDLLVFFFFAEEDGDVI